MKWKNVDWVSVGITAVAIASSVFVFCYGTSVLRDKFNDDYDKIPSVVIEVVEVEDNPVCKITEEEFEPVYPLSGYDRWYVECMVAGEAKGESLLGKMAVAQCILNAMQKEDLTPAEVQKVYQYSGWDENLETNNLEAYEEVAHAVWCVFDNGEVVTDKPILFFYAYRMITSSWHESLNYADTIGGHKFFYLEEDIEAEWFVEMREEN